MYKVSKILSQSQQINSKAKKRFLHLIQFKTSSSTFSDWKDTFLDNTISRNLITRDSEMQRLQQLYFSFDNSYTYQRALALLATSLSFALHENLISNLRACFQIIVNYSLHISDISWISRKKTISLEKFAIALKKTLQLSRQSFDFEHLFLNKCLYHAFTIEKEATVELIRVSMIKMIAELTIHMQSSIIFRFYNSIDESQARNAIVLLEKLKSQSHHLVEIAFSLVFNPQLKKISVSTSVSSKKDYVS